MNENENKFVELIKIVLIFAMFIGSAVLTGAGGQLELCPLAFGGLAAVIVSLIIMYDYYN